MADNKKNNIVERLRNCGKTPYFIAKSTGLSNSSIANWLSGKTFPTPANIAILEHFLQGIESVDKKDNSDKDALNALAHMNEILAESNKVLVESNKNLVESNKSLAESNRLLAESNKTMADMQKSLLEETKNILRRIERGDATTVVSVADVG